MCKKNIQQADTVRFFSEQSVFEEQKESKKINFISDTQTIFYSSLPWIRLDKIVVMKQFHQLLYNP